MQDGGVGAGGYIHKAHGRHTKVSSAHTGSGEGGGGGGGGGGSSHMLHEHELQATKPSLKPE